MHVSALLCLNLKINYCLSRVVMVGFVLEVQVYYNLLIFVEPLGYGVVLELYGYRGYLV